MFLLCTLGVWLAGGHFAGWWQVRQERRAWAETGRPMDDLLASFPRQGDSDAARRLDQLTRPLGVRVLRDTAQPAQVDDRKLYDAMTKSMARLSKSAEDAWEPPPTEVRAYLDAHRPELAAVAAYLAAASEISWETDIDAGPEAPLPSLLAHRHLHTLLLFEAIERHRRGDTAGRDQMMEAASRQGATLSHRPDLISQLIAIALALDEHSVLRRLPDAAPAWKGRLEQRQFRQGIVDSFQQEAYSWLTLTREYRGAADLESRNPASGPVAWIIRGVSVPYVRLGMAGISRHLRRGRALALAGDPCTRTGEELEAEVKAGIPRWDIISKIAVPSVMRASASGVNADLDGEHTRLVLEARARSRPGTGRAEPSFSVASKVCAGLVWRHSSERNGGWTIQADPPPTFDPQAGRKWTFTVSSGSRLR